MQWRLQTITTVVQQVYDYLGKAANCMKGKTTVKEAGLKTAEKPMNFSISAEGRNMLRELVSKFEPASDYVSAKELTIQN